MTTIEDPSVLGEEHHEPTDEHLIGSFAYLAVLDRADNLLVLTRRMDCKRRQGQVDLPGGKYSHDYDRGSIEATVRRETEEETGLTGVSHNYHNTYSFNDETGSGVQVLKKRLVIVFFGYIAGEPEPDVTLSPEHTASAWVPLDEALGMYAELDDESGVGAAQERALIDLAKFSHPTQMSLDFEL